MSCEKKKIQKCYPRFKASECSSSCPPSCPPGEQGPQGIQGEQGPPGPGAIESAFRANKVDTQPYNGGFITVRFPNELFDLNSEYNGVDTFVPKQDGIYQINSTVIFTSGVLVPNYTIIYHLLVNGLVITTDTKIVSDSRLTTVSVATIYELNIGDIVNMSISSSEFGEITFFGDTQSSSFSAARFPFTS